MVFNARRTVARSRIAQRACLHKPGNMCTPTINLAGRYCQWARWDSSSSYTDVYFSVKDGSGDCLPGERGVRLPEWF